MLVKCYVLFLYGVFTVDAVGVDFVGIAVVDCVLIVFYVNVVPEILAVCLTLQNTIQWASRS